MRPPPSSREPAAAHDGDVVEVRVDALAPGGDAVGRQQDGAAAGRATFVALAAPGDRVRARLVRAKARVAWAELLSIEEPSARRVAPPCPLFGRCGGCQWQHVELEAQRAAKRDFVARALGLTAAAVPLLAPSADGRAYRERAQLVVGDRATIGFHARRSHEVVDVPRCLLFAPALQRALDIIRGEGQAWPAGTEIDLQAGREGVHVAISYPRATAPGARRAAARDVSWPAALSAAWLAAGIVGVRVVGASGEASSAGLVDVDIAPPGEAALRIAARAFAQVGSAANQALLGVVLLQVGEHPGAVLELYAGSGNFTRALLGRAARVEATDADGAAVGRGRRNAPGAIWLVRPPRTVDADTVVVDPPRDGLDAANLEAAVQARRRIVYVSCDPQTLGRDAARLSQAGFALRGAVALDLMPHTYHVEVVATFDRV